MKLCSALLFRPLRGINGAPIRRRYGQTRVPAMNGFEGIRRRCTLVLAMAALAGCASLPDADPLRVSLAGVESLPSEGLELRLAVKLRVQNPNDAPVKYDGVALTLELRGLDFASGVSDVQGSVPRFGETVLVVPVTVPAFAVAKQVYAFAMGDRAKVTFIARGKLAGSGLGSLRFESKGEFDLPTGLAQPAAAPARN
jgi:LEA14-like dessication related protein